MTTKSPLPRVSLSSFVRATLVALALAGFAIPAAAENRDVAPPTAKTSFGVRVIDEATGHGVPLVELRTVNETPLVTDSGGWIAFDEPGLMNREVYFAVSGPGYEHAPDGFGFRGVRLKTTPGARAEVKVKRVNVAQRLHRLTGQGIHRDSELLGVAFPDAISNLNAGVVGQDSVQAVPYRGRVFWLWGDTNLANYPLGNFHTTAATTPGPNELHPEELIPFEYFMDPRDRERVRKMKPSDEPGPVWLFGLLNATDESGRETLLAHYTRQQSLEKIVEHGLVRFDDEAGVFQNVAKLDLKETWRFPSHNAFRVKDAEGDHFYFAAPLAHVRVKADWKSLVAPDAYEALTFDAETRDYRWTKAGPPTTQRDEEKLLTAGKLPAERARHRLIDAATGERVFMHGGSVGWNEHRKRWLLIGVQEGGAGAPSYLGEVWYAEADSPTGPWGRAVKIATHPNYSFYNPRRHDFLDAEGGRVVYFEGTYTRTFSNNPVATPRYDYNQILYKLDLSDDRLKPAQESAGR